MWLCDKSQAIKKKLMIWEKQKEIETILKEIQKQLLIHYDFKLHDLK